MIEIISENEDYEVPKWTLDIYVYTHVLPTIDELIDEGMNTKEYDGVVSQIVAEYVGLV